MLGSKLFELVSEKIASGEFTIKRADIQNDSLIFVVTETQASPDVMPSAPAPKPRDGRRRKRQRHASRLSAEDLQLAVLEHLPSDERFAREIKEVAKDMNRSNENVRRTIYNLIEQGRAREVTGQKQYCKYIKTNSDPATTTPSAPTSSGSAGSLRLRAGKGVL